MLCLSIVLPFRFLYLCSINTSQAINIKVQLMQMNKRHLYKRTRNSQVVSTGCNKTWTIVSTHMRKKEPGNHWAHVLKLVRYHFPPVQKQYNKCPCKKLAPKLIDFCGFEIGVSSWVVDLEPKQKKHYCPFTETHPNSTRKCYIFYKI